MTRSADREVPSFSLTEPTVLESLGEGWALSTPASMWNFTPFFSIIDLKIFPTSAPMMRSRGVDSMPTIETSLSAERALATSIPMKEEPITTIFFFFCSPTAERMAWTSGMVRRRKMLESSLKPGKGSALGVPPGARMSLVYG